MNRVVPGFWYHHKKENEKYQICNTEDYNYENFSKKLKVVDEAYPKFLKKITSELNKIHKLSWCEKDWEIIIGTWIKKYLVVISDRLSIIDTNLRKGNEFFFIKEDKSKINLNSRDISEFISNIFNDRWNEELFKRLHHYKISKDESYLFHKKKIDFSLKKKSFFKSLKVKIFNCLTKFYVSFFCSKSKIIFSRPYFGSKSKFLKLLISLKEFPIIYYLDDEPVSVNYNQELRDQINLRIDTVEFHKISSLLFKECFPRIYIEGFDEILKRIEKSSLPADKKIIFTCNIHNDSIFKFWTAKQKNIGAKLILAQHGGGYNFFDYDEKRDYQLSICDKYLTYGWVSEKFRDKTKKFSIVNNEIYQEKSLYGENIYLIMNNYDNYIYSADYNTSIDLLNSEKKKNYTELYEISQFLNNLKDDIRKKILVRPHPNHRRRHTTSSFEKMFKNKIQIDDNFKKPILKLLKSARINIVPQPYGTTFIYSMSKNFPTVTLFPHDLRHLNIDTRKVFTELFSSGICHKNHDSLKNFIEKNYDNFSDWWESAKTQKARIAFCEEQGRVLPNRMELLKDFLMTEKKQLN